MSVNGEPKPAPDVQNWSVPPYGETPPETVIVAVCPCPKSWIGTLAGNGVADAD